MKIQLSLILAVGIFLSFCGLNAADSIGEHRRYLVAPQGEPVSDLTPDYKEGETLFLKWTNQVTLDVLFDGEKVKVMKYTNIEGVEYLYNSDRSDGIMMEDDEVGIFQRIALNARKGWRTIPSLDGTLAYEVEPYTLVSITTLPFEKWALIFKRGETLLAIPDEFWAGGFNDRPEVGEKIIIGRASDQFCAIQIVNGSPKVPEAMLLGMREYAKKWAKQ